MINLNLNDLTFENVGQWPIPAKFGLIGFMSLILISLGYWLFIKSTFEDLDNLRAQEITLKAEFETKQRQASNLDAYRNQMRIMEERFGNMLKQLPTENEMPGLLEDISRTGIASGLTFELFAPLPEVRHDFYIELPIKIEVVGDYHQFAVFLNRVAQMNRIVTLHDFVVEGDSPDKQKSNPGEKLSMKMTVKIYRYGTK